MGRGLIRNVVIRILAWSKIRKTGGALRPQQILYLYGTRRTTQNWYGTTVVLSEHDGAMGTCF